MPRALVLLLALLVAAGCLGGCEPNGRLLLSKRPRTDGDRVELTQEQVDSIPELAELVDRVGSENSTPLGVGVERADEIVSQLRAWGATGDQYQAMFNHDDGTYALIHQRICSD